MSEGIMAALPGLVCAAFAERLPALRECVAHDGRFDLRELGRFIARAPSVRVACLGLKPREKGEHALLMAAFIITTDRRGLARGTAALTILETLAARTTGAFWGRDDIGAAERVTGANLYSADADRQGVALWALSWEHRLVPGTLAPAQGVVPSALYLGFAPKIGEDHEADYIGPVTREEGP